MDLILRTNSDDPALALRNVERFADDSGFCAELVVRSRGYAARQLFHFDRSGLQAFVRALEQMDSTLKGAATLQTPYENHFMRLEVDKLGHVCVAGELRDYEASQHLKFCFRTDQTCLAPFAEELPHCLHLQPVRPASRRVAAEQLGQERA
jgi:hypothetical protein